MPAESSPRRAFIALSAGWLVLTCAPGCTFWSEPTAPVAPPSPPRADDTELARLVPPDAETVIEVDVTLLRRSEFTAEALVNPDARLRDRSAAMLGYDVATDVDRVVYATASATGGDQPTLAIVQGRFRMANVEAAFRERWPKATADTWRGVPLLSSGEDALATLTTRTFVSGPPARVRAVVDRAFGGDTTAAADEGRGTVRRDLLGFAGMPPPAMLATMVLDEKIRARVGDPVLVPRSLRAVGVRLDVGESLVLRALGVLDDRATAAELARRLGALFNDRGTRQTLVALGLPDVLPDAKVSAEGTRVRLALTVGADRRPRTAAALRTIVQALRTGVDPRPDGSW